MCRISETVALNSDISFVELLAGSRDIWQIYEIWRKQFFVLTIRQPWNTHASHNRWQSKPPQRVRGLDVYIDIISRFLCVESTSRLSHLGQRWWTFVMRSCNYHRTSTKRQRHDAKAWWHLVIYSISAQGCQFCHVMILYWDHFIM